MSTEKSMNIQNYLDKVYEVECAGSVVKLKPIKAWVLAPKGKKGVIIGLFKCPDGKVVRKVIGKAE